MRGFKPRRVKLKSHNTIYKKVIMIAIVAVLVIAIAIGTVVIAINLKQNGEKIKLISISSRPDKVEYYMGEEPVFEGISIEVVLNNGTSYFINEKDCVFSGFDSTNVIDKQTITVHYEGFTATFNVSIKEPPKATPVLSDIYLDPMPKTEYKVGEALNTTGAFIVRQYSDGTETRINLTNQNVYGFSQVNGPGTYTLTVKYAEGGILKETTYTITVTE